MPNTELETIFEQSDTQSLKKFMNPLLTEQSNKIVQALNDFKINRVNRKLATTFNQDYDGTATQLGALGRWRAVSEDSALWVQEITYRTRRVNGKQQLQLMVFSENHSIVQVFPKEYAWLISEDPIDPNKQISELKRRIGDVQTLRAHQYKGKFLSKASLAALYGDLSWYQLIVGNMKDAVYNAEKGAKLSKSTIWVQNNLALGYLLSSQHQKAYKICSAYKTHHYDNGKSFKAVFLDDLKVLADKGVSQPDPKQYLWWFD